MSLFIVMFIIIKNTIGFINVAAARLQRAGSVFQSCMSTASSAHDDDGDDAKTRASHDATGESG
jgi:hypothetical protein